MADGLLIYKNNPIVGKLTNLSSPAGLAVFTLASHVSGQGSIPGGHRYASTLFPFAIGIIFASTTKLFKIIMKNIKKHFENF